MDKQIKFRCSRLGELMTGSRTKGELFGDTAKSYILEEVIKAKYGHKKLPIDNKYFSKGIDVEDDSIALYSNVKNRLFIKNEEHFENDWIKGTPDVVEDPIIDTKSSWDIFTFAKAKLEPNYVWQLHGYMWLTNTNNAVLVYCLMDTPEKLVLDEKKRWYYKLGGDEMTNFGTDEYKRVCGIIDKNASYEHIPSHKRIKEFDIESDIEKVEMLIERVEAANKYAEELWNQI